MRQISIKKNWSTEALVSLLKVNRYKNKWVTVLSVAAFISSMTMFLFFKYMTDTIYLSWLFLAVYYLLVFVILRISKFANSKDVIPTPFEKAFGYTIFGVIILSFMFLLGRDDVQAKSRLKQYTTVELVKGAPKCGRNLAGNSTLLVLEGQNGITLIPWRHIEGVRYSTVECSSNN